MGDRDLLASVQRIGPQVPGLEWCGELVDGRKKARMCAELGIRFDVHHAATREEACSILWTRHPERAIELAETRSVLELARICGTSAVAVAKVLQALKPKKKRQRHAAEESELRRTRVRPKMLRRLFVLEPELYAYAQEAAAQLGHKNVNRLVRDALWARVALLVPNCPQFQPARVQPPNGARAVRRRTG